MALPLSNPYDVYEVLIFNRLCVKFHDISISQKKVTAIQVKLLLLFSKQFCVLSNRYFLMRKNTVQAQQPEQKNHLLP